MDLAHHPIGLFSDGLLAVALRLAGVVRCRSDAMLGIAAALLARPVTRSIVPPMTGFVFSIVSNAVEPQGGSNGPSRPDVLYVDVRPHSATVPDAVLERKRPAG